MSISNNLIAKYVLGRESILIDAYILHGPAALKKELDLVDSEWQIIFDYLIFEQNLLFKVVSHSSDFFLNSYVRHGMAHLRDVLNVVDSKYDLMWEIVFDFLAISNQGLYLHVLDHRKRYASVLQSRGSDFVRKILGIWKPKYINNWEQVLNLFLGTVCDDLFSERTFSDGLKSFTSIMNGLREHRPIMKSGILF
jgi:hypothetical protein